MHQAAKQYIRLITQVLNGISWANESEPVLFSGKGNLLLYFLELYIATKDPSWINRIKALQVDILNLVGKDSVIIKDSSLANGISGLIYLSKRLQETGLLYTPFGDWLAENKRNYKTSIASMVNQGILDRMNGLYGVLHSRLLTDTVQVDKKFTANLLAVLLPESSISNVYELFKDPRRQDTVNQLNLGAYNGLSGILQILMLAFVRGYGRNIPQLIKVIKLAAEFILKHKMEVSEEYQLYSYFPMNVRSETDYITTSNQLGWSNSDLNHICVFYGLAHILNDKRYNEIANFMGMQSVSRKNHEETQVTGSCILLGSSGVALQYKQLIRLNDTTYYQQAYEYWIEQTITSLQKELKVGTFSGKECNLLNGLTGVSLTLLGYCYGKPAHWENLLFP